MMPGFEVLGVGDRAAMSLPKDRWLGDNDSGPLPGDGPDYKLLDAGDTALVVEFGDSIDRRISATVLALARRVSQIDLAGVVECVPTFRSLMVHYDSLVLATSTLSARTREPR